MELRQLEYFVAVAEERNFTRAAERVHVSQSGISAQIRQLERELGATLFDRSTRTVTLTPAGRAALDHARAALAAAAAVDQAVSDVTGLLRGRLTVGMVIGCTLTPLFDALAAFHRAHPGVELSLWEDNSDRLVDGVRAGTLDLALVGAAGAPPHDLNALTIISEPLVAVVPPGHPLATQPQVSLGDLVDHPLACMPPGTGLRAVFDEACTVRGIEPTITWEASAAEALAELTFRELAVAVLSESMATHYRDRLTALPLDDVDIPALLALVWKPSTGPALHALIEHCEQAFGESAPTPTGPQRTAESATSRKRRKNPPPR